MLSGLRMAANTKYQVSKNSFIKHIFEQYILYIIAINYYQNIRTKRNKILCKIYPLGIQAPLQ